MRFRMSLVLGMNQVIRKWLGESSFPVFKGRP